MDSTDTTARQIWNGIGDGIRLGNNPRNYFEALQRQEMPRLTSQCKSVVLDSLDPPINGTKESRQLVLGEECPNAGSGLGWNYWFFFWKAARITSGFETGNRLQVDDGINEVFVNRMASPLMERLKALPSVRPIQVTHGVVTDGEIYLRWLDGQRPGSHSPTGNTDPGLSFSNQRTEPLTLNDSLKCLTVLRLDKVYESEN